MPRKRRRPLLAGFRTLVVLTALVVGLPALGTWLYARPRTFDADTVPRRDVAVVLGASVLPNGTPSGYLQARLDLAAELHAEGRVRAVIVSGNREAGYDEPAAMRRSLVAAGVPSRVIVSDNAGYDTYDSCVRARDTFGVDRLLVVTQSYHLPRTLTTCGLVGVDAIGVGDDTVRNNPRTWWLGVLRELGANWKMIADVVTRREPTGGDRRAELDEVLGR